MAISSAVVGSLGNARKAIDCSSFLTPTNYGLTGIGIKGL